MQPTWLNEIGSLLPSSRTTSNGHRPTCIRQRQAECQALTTLEAGAAVGWAATKSWLSGRAVKPAASAPARRQQFDGSDGALRSQSTERLSGSTALQLERSYSDVIQQASGSFLHVDVSPKDRTHSLGDGTPSRQRQNDMDGAQSSRIDDGRHRVRRTAHARGRASQGRCRVGQGAPGRIRRGRFVNCIGQFLSNNKPLCCVQGLLRLSPCGGGFFPHFVGIPA